MAPHGGLLFCLYRGRNYAGIEIPAGSIGPVRAGGRALCRPETSETEVAAKAA